MNSKVTKSLALLNHTEATLFDYYKRPCCAGASMVYVSSLYQKSRACTGYKNTNTAFSSFRYNQTMAVTKAAFSENDALLIMGNGSGRSHIVSSEDGLIQAELLSRMQRFDQCSSDFRRVQACSHCIVLKRAYHL